MDFSYKIIQITSNRAEQNTTDHTKIRYLDNFSNYLHFIKTLPTPLISSINKNSPKPQGFRAEMRCKKRDCVYSPEAAFRVFNKRETMVMGPTPPGTGVM